MHSFGAFDRLDLDKFSNVLIITIIGFNSSLVNQVLINCKIKINNIKSFLIKIIEKKAAKIPPI